MMIIRGKTDFRYLAAILLLSSAYMCFSFIDEPKKVPLASSLENIPLSIGPWEGSAGAFNESVLNNAGVDHYIMRTYHTDKEEPVSIYIGFYSYQQIGHTIHSPRHCYPGSGWNPVSDKKLLVPILNAPKGKLAVRKLLAQKGNEKQIVYYWYQSRGRNITDEYDEKFYLIFDTIFRGRNDGSLVRVSAPIASSELEAEAHLQDFINQFYPYLMLCLPR